MRLAPNCSPKQRGIEGTLEIYRLEGPRQIIIKKIERRDGSVEFVPFGAMFNNIKSLRKPSLKESVDRKEVLFDPAEYKSR